MTQALLLTETRLRNVAFRNRIIVAPMCMYQVEDGQVGDYHLVHLGRFALGGAGLIFVEATAVSAIGRITKGCPGIWTDAQMERFRPITNFMRAQGAVPGIQLAHAGPKTSSHKPWEDAGSPLGKEEAAWDRISASTVPGDTGWPEPLGLAAAELNEIVQQYRAAARRADVAGFDVVEVHAAHGYLLHSFLSPLSNMRTDEFGGDLERRMRFPLRVVAAVREVWPAGKPLFVRISSVDGVGFGWSIEDSVAFAKALKTLGVDVVDCSSGGIIVPREKRLVQRVPGFHVPFAERVRREAGIATVAVGLIRDPDHAEAILQAAQADFIAVAREALFNPNWPLTAALELEGAKAWPLWPVEHGLRLMLRAQQQGETFGPDRMQESA